MYVLLVIVSVNYYLDFKVNVNLLEEGTCQFERVMGL